MRSTLAMLPLSRFVSKTAAHHSTCKRENRHQICNILLYIHTNFSWPVCVKPQGGVETFQKSKETVQKTFIVEVWSQRWVFQVECIGDCHDSRETQLNKRSPPATEKQQSVHRGLTWFCFAQTTWLFSRLLARLPSFFYDKKRRLQACCDHAWLWLSVFRSELLFCHLQNRRVDRNQMFTRRPTRSGPPTVNHYRTQEVLLQSGPFYFV